MKLRNNRNIVVKIRKATMRERCKMEETLKLYYKIMHCCSCAQSGKACGYDTTGRASVKKEGFLANIATKSATNTTVRLDGDIATAFSPDRIQEHRVEHIQSTEAQKKHDCDRLKSMKELEEVEGAVLGSFEALRMILDCAMEDGVSGGAQISDSQAQGRSVEQKAVDDMLKDETRSRDECATCKRYEQVVTTLEIAIVEIDEVIHALEEHIVECTMKISMI